MELDVQYLTVWGRYQGDYSKEFRVNIKRFLSICLCSKRRDSESVVRSRMKLTRQQCRWSTAQTDILRNTWRKAYTVKKMWRNCSKKTFTIIKSWHDTCFENGTSCVSRKIMKNGTSVELKVCHPINDQDTVFERQSLVENETTAVNSHKNWNVIPDVYKVSQKDGCSAF